MSSYIYNTAGIIYAVTYGLDQVEAFRYRVKGEQVVLHDVIHRLENGKILLPFSVQAHHFLVDGIHKGNTLSFLTKVQMEFNGEPTAAPLTVVRG